MLTLPAHTATHIDLVFRDRRVPPQRMIGADKLFDVTGATAGQFQLSDVETQVEIQAGDFVFFRSAVPRSAFTLYCFPLHIENIDAIPARVLVKIEAEL